MEPDQNDLANKMSVLNVNATEFVPSWASPPAGANAGASPTSDAGKTEVVIKNHYRTWTGYLTFMKYFFVKAVLF